MTQSEMDQSLSSGVEKDNNSIISFDEHEQGSNVGAFTVGAETSSGEDFNITLDKVVVEQISHRAARKIYRPVVGTGGVLAVVALLASVAMEVYVFSFAFAVAAAYLFYSYKQG